MVNLFQKMIEFSKNNQKASVTDVIKMTFVAHFKEHTLNKLEANSFFKNFGPLQPHVNAMGTSLVDSVSTNHVESIVETLKTHFPFVDNFLNNHKKIKNIVTIIDAQLLHLIHQVHTSDNDQAKETTSNKANDVIHL